MRDDMRPRTRTVGQNFDLIRQLCWESTQKEQTWRRRKVASANTASITERPIAGNRSNPGGGGKRCVLERVILHLASGRNGRVPVPLQNL